MMNINSLPDWPLLDIFGQRPLTELICSTGPVCARWQSLLYSACCRRRVLTLLVGKEAEELDSLSRFVIPAASAIVMDNIADPTTPQLLAPLSERTHLKFDTITAETAQALVEAFINVTELEIVQERVPSLVADQVCTLLEGWAPKLRSLRLACWYVDENGEEQSETISARLNCLVKCINSMPRLEHLSFECSNWFRTSNTDTRCLNMPVFGRLRELRFYSHDTADLVFDSLRDYAQANVHLEKIELASRMPWDIVDLFCANLRPDFSGTKISQACYYSPPTTQHELFGFCAHFGSLTKLFIRLGEHISFHQLVECLASLPRLIYLAMEIDFSRPPPPSLPAIPSPVQLVPVRAFDIALRSTEHTNLDSLQLGPLLPNVQVVQYANKRARSCPLCKKRADASVVANCKRLQMQAFKQLRALRLVHDVTEPKPKSYKPDQL